MAKSLQQKQKEAIERKRINFKRIQTDWLYYQTGGIGYEHEKQTDSVESANKLAKKYDDMLTKAAKEAEVDRHGNPLTYDHRGNPLT